KTAPRWTEFRAFDHRELDQLAEYQCPSAASYHAPRTLPTLDHLCSRLIFSEEFVDSARQRDDGRPPVRIRRECLPLVNPDVEAALSPRGHEGGRVTAPVLDCIGQCRRIVAGTKDNPTIGQATVHLSHLPLALLARMNPRLTIHDHQLRWRT